MHALPVILVFDIGKTNKKILLFDESYALVDEETTHLPETTDEDGMICEDVHGLTKWMRDAYQKVMRDERYDVRAINISGYGASFVYLDESLEPFLPLYNYLKEYPQPLQQRFYKTYGGETVFSAQTASPVLGSLNSGMQLYRLKEERPAQFKALKYALHLPQYLSFILTHEPCSEITSIGCHTNLWDFGKNGYHEWVTREGIASKFPPLKKSTDVVVIRNHEKTIPVGIGLHDSSAALIPYLKNFHEPFILLSTGTWCISLNPFNNTPLTTDELQHDGLCYLTYQGQPVKASRLFAGYEHEQQIKRLSDHYGEPIERITAVAHDPEIIDRLKNRGWEARSQRDTLQHSSFEEVDLKDFEDSATAYHALIMNIVARQQMSTRIVMQGTEVKRIFVDGGFSKNSIYMHLLATLFPGVEVFAASVPQATALGAALIMHTRWNKKPLPADLIRLRHYAVNPL
ncbi:FGGY-family carbohydrate kinase [Chryseolinea soli]|uniref:Carbohydrate kinase n=1 Tax=Chryseolinea soli TaxID=2321403 RepID=A0A385SGQ7_9BACT|nr:FGGY family carbohydrate kinase [Chryseolinea soli]AYB30062.1 carbohydrate kinase [Chryseolinea soli]